jgi:hypothetical protein
MATEDYIGGIGGLMTMAALFAGNQQNKNNQDLMNLLNQNQEGTETETATDLLTGIEDIDLYSPGVVDEQIRTDLDTADQARIEAEKEENGFLRNIFNSITNYTVGNDGEALDGAEFDEYVNNNKASSAYNALATALQVGGGIPGMIAGSAMKTDPIPDALTAVTDDAMYKQMQSSGGFDNDSLYRLKEIDRLNNNLDIDVEDYPTWYNEDDIEGTIAGKYVTDTLPLTSYDPKADADQAISYANPYSEKRDGETIYPLGLEIADIMQEGQPPVPGLELSNSEFNDKDANEALREKLYAETDRYNELLNQGEDTFDYRNIVKEPLETDYNGFYDTENNKIGLGVNNKTGEFNSDDVVDTILHEATHQADLGNAAPEEIAVRRLMETLSGKEDLSLKTLEEISLMTEEELIEFLKKRKKEGKSDIPNVYLKHILDPSISNNDFISGLNNSGFNVNSDEFNDNFASNFNTGGRVQHSQLPPERGPMAAGVGSLFKQK